MTSLPPGSNAAPTVLVPGSDAPESPDLAAGGTPSPAGPAGTSLRKLPPRSSRLVARLIDLITWAIVGSVLTALLTGSTENSPLASAAMVITAVLVFVVPLARGGSTLGKRLLRLRVVRVNDAPVGMARALLRESFWFVTLAIPLLQWLNSANYLWNKPLRRCLHDKVAGTYVSWRG